MCQERELEGEGTVVEISSPRSLKIIFGFIGLFFCSLGLVSFLSAVFPQMLEHRPEKLPTTAERVFFFFLGGPFGLGTGLYAFQPWFYRLRADAYSLTESLGWKEKRVFWSDVDSYTMEPNSNQHREANYHIEPVMRAADGTILFKAADTIIVCDKATVERRRQFWNMVQGHLLGKQRIYTPPLPIPSIYEGKSTVWKVKRIAALLLGTVSYMCAWAGAVIWGFSRPDLPSWILATISFGGLSMPVGVGHMALFLKNRRQQKLHAELVDAPASTCSSQIRVQ